LAFDCVLVAHCCKDVAECVDVLVWTPNESRAEEGQHEDDTVDELGSGAGHLEFVEEPVEVEEGRG